MRRAKARLIFWLGGQRIVLNIGLIVFLAVARILVLRYPFGIGLRLDVLLQLTGVLRVLPGLGEVGIEAFDQGVGTAVRQLAGKRSLGLVVRIVLLEGTLAEIIVAHLEPPSWNHESLLRLRCFVNHPPLPPRKKLSEEAETAT